MKFILINIIIYYTYTCIYTYKIRTCQSLTKLRDIEMYLIILDIYVLGNEIQYKMVEWCPWSERKKIWNYYMVIFSSKWWTLLINLFISIKNRSNEKWKFLFFLYFCIIQHLTSLEFVEWCACGNKISGEYLLCTVWQLIFTGNGWLFFI